MLGEGQVGIRLQLFGELLPQSFPFHRGPAGDLVDCHISCEAPSFEPALDGRTRDSEEILDLLPWDATVDGREYFQSEVLRVCVHGPILI